MAQNSNLWFGSDGKVTLAQHCDGSGWSVELGEGQHHHSVWGHNDDASFISVPEGMKATLNEHSRNDDRFPGNQVVVEGPADMNFCQENTDFNDELSELDVETMAMPDADISSMESDLRAYARAAFNKTEGEAKEIYEYAANVIVGNPSWEQHTQERAAEEDRSFEKQLMHEAHWQLYKKDGCKYCSTEDTTDTTDTSGSTPDPVIDTTDEDVDDITNGDVKEAGFFSGNTALIIGAVAVLGIAYVMTRGKNTATATN